MVIAFLRVVTELDWEKIELRELSRLANMSTLELKKRNPNGAKIAAIKRTMEIISGLPNNEELKTEIEVIAKRKEKNGKQLL